MYRCAWTAPPNGRGTCRNQSRTSRSTTRTYSLTSPCTRRACTAPSCSSRGSRPPPTNEPRRSRFSRNSTYSEWLTHAWAPPTEVGKPLAAGGLRWRKRSASHRLSGGYAAGRACQPTTARAFALVSLLFLFFDFRNHGDSTDVIRFVYRRRRHRVRQRRRAATCIRRDGARHEPGCSGARRADEWVGRGGRFGDGTNFAVTRVEGEFLLSSPCGRLE